MHSESRLAGLRSHLEHESVDLFVALRPANVRYLTGFDRVFDEEPGSLAIVEADRAYVITDSRFETAARAAAEGGPWEIVISAQEPLRALIGMIAEQGVGTVAAESSMPHRLFELLSSDSGADVISTDGWVEKLRAVKDAEEIERIERAQALTDQAFEHILSFVAAGRSELEIALELEFFMRRNGSEGVAFPPIVASGPNSAMPHAGVTERILAEGDFLKLDFGARVDGYCADMTRTIAIGTADDRQREIYETVLAANLAGLLALSAGVAGSEVDAAARRVIVDAGFGERFGHGLGHGVGLEVHEGPSLSARATELLPAMAVVTVEPGVYLPGFGGVRIEDLVVVEEGGCRVLTRSPKELIEV